MSEGTAAIDVADDQHGCVGVAADAKVGQVHTGQVHLRRASRSLQHHDVGVAGHTVVGVAHDLPEVRCPLPPGHLGQHPVDLAQPHHLAPDVCLGLEQDRVVVDRRGHSGGKSLEVLGGADLTALNHPGVIGHVLRLERCDANAATAQRGAQPRGQHALAGPTRRSGNHERPHAAILHLGGPGQEPSSWIRSTLPFRGLPEASVLDPRGLVLVTCEPEPAERLTQGTRYESGADAQRYG